MTSKEKDVKQDEYDPYRDIEDEIDYKKTFGEALAKYRDEKKLSIRKLAVKTGLSASYLSYLERGIHGPPSIEVTKKLAHALDVNPDIMLGDAGLIDPKVTNAICKNPEQIADAIRKSTKDSTKMITGLVGLALVFWLSYGKQFDSEGKEETPEDIYKSLKEMIEENGNTFIEEQHAHSEMTKVLKLWRKDLKKRENNEN